MDNYYSIEGTSQSRGNRPSHRKTHSVSHEEQNDKKGDFKFGGRSMGNRHRSSSDLMNQATIEALKIKSSTKIFGTSNEALTNLYNEICNEVCAKKTLLYYILMILDFNLDLLIKIGKSFDTSWNSFSSNNKEES